MLAMGATEIHSDFNIPILMYHYLGKTDNKDYLPYYISHKRFYSQMRLLMSRGYRSVDLTKIIEDPINERTAPEKIVVITFDDGHQSFYDVAVPILREFGFQATMFLITAKIGKDGYLTWSQIEEMSSLGMKFGSHGVNHSILTEINQHELEYEIFQSKEILENRLGYPIYSFSYRGGHFNEKIKQLVRSAGYKCAVSTILGQNGKGADVFALKRIGIRQWDHIFKFHDKIAPKSFSTKLSIFWNFYLNKTYK